MRPVSLAHLTLPDATPLELIDAAAAAGFSHVGLRIVPPVPDAARPSIVGDVRTERAIGQRLSDTGVKLLDVEVFWLGPQTRVQDWKAALALGAGLGARYLVVICDDPDRSRAIDSFAELCALAAEFGLKPALEFIPYTHVARLADALQIVRSAGAANAGLLVDLLHLSRSGGSPADLGSIAPELIHLAHVCDAPAGVPPTADALRREARGGRLYPGEGALPVREFLAALPAGVPIAIEAPNPRYGHLTFAERAQHARVAMGQVLSPGHP
jgi:sugar phosphate isomerase/epimerase